MHATAYAASVVGVWPKCMLDPTFGSLFMGHVTRCLRLALLASALLKCTLILLAHVEAVSQHVRTSV
jgi:hypothetical protein